MIAATRRWLRRNKTPIAVGFGVIGIGYVATQYVLGKINDARERMSGDRIARENLRRRFEQNQEDCTFTVLALLPTATDNILAALETERITFELQQQKAAKLATNGEGHPSELGSTPPSVTDDDGRSIMSMYSDSGIHASQLMGLPSSASTGEGVQDGGQQLAKARKSKLQLWNDLKISAITRAFTLIYTLALLTLLTRIQLNLLGRRSYLSSVVSLATASLSDSAISLENNDDDSPDQAYGHDFETNRRYLTFSWWLLHRGWKDVMLKMQDVVREVFGGMSIREDITMEKFSELTLQVRRKVEGATDEERRQTQWLQYLLPPREQEDFVLKESGVSIEASQHVSSIKSPLRRLLDETSDLIESPPFSQVLTSLLDAGFSVLVDQKLAQQAWKMSHNAGIDLANVRVQEVVDVAPVKLPIVLAPLTRQAHSIGNGAPNEYLQAMEQVQDLEAFAAVVYSSNWEAEILPATEDLEKKDKETETGSESMVDIGSVGAFENVWGKAVHVIDHVGGRA